MEQLFFYLQAEPEHMASLLLSSTSLPFTVIFYLEERRDPEKFSVLNDCLAPVFGYVTEQREAFLLTRALGDILLRKIEKISKPDELNHSEEERLVGQVFAEGLLDLGQTSTLSLPALPLFEGAFNLDPEDVFLFLHGTKPSDGQAAIDDHTVQQVLEHSKLFIADASERIVEAVVKGYRPPPALRYLCIFLADALRRQFPSAPAVDVYRTVAVFAYSSHARHLISTKTTAEGADAHGRLESVLQFLEYAVANRGYGNSKWYLTSLNKQIHNISIQFQ